MKKEFEKSKVFPNIEIIIKRDSVCAADDINAPHEKTIKLQGFIDSIEFIKQVKNLYSLPSIAGGKATWICLLNGETIAVVAQQWPAPKAIITELQFKENNELYFQYHAQKSPEKFL